MTLEEALKIAIEKYPIGTTHSGSNAGLKTNPKKSFTTTEKPYIDSLTKTIYGSMAGAIYIEGASEPWARIISSPKQKNYPIY